MDEQGNVRDMIQEGKTKLQWDRKIPDEEIENLRALLDVENFDSNLPQAIKQIHLIVHPDKNIHDFSGYQQN